MSDKWTLRMIRLAAHVAEWSKDASTRVGAVIADRRNRIVSIGFNGYPAGVEDVAHTRDEKLRRVLHAEQNALAFAQRDVTGCSIFVTHHPCARCMAQIIQAGIARVVCPAPQAAFAERWAEDIASAKEMAAEAGVLIDAVPHA